MTILMTCPRDYILRTMLGHTIEFKAGEPTEVPEAAYAEAINKNIVPVERKDKEQPAFGMVYAEITGSLRSALIYQALADIVARNQSEDFTGGGVPKAKVVSEAIGINVSATEVGKFWTNYRQIVAENSEVPSHPKIEIVRELQSLSTRKQMEDFAEDHGITVKINSRSLKELKGFLLHQVIGVMNGPVSEAEYVKPASLMED